MLLDGYWKVRAAFDRCIVGHDHRLVTVNHSDACDDARTWRPVVVHAVCSKGAEFKKGRIRVDGCFDSFANEHLSALFVAFYCGLAAAFLNDVELQSKLRDEFLHR